MLHITGLYTALFILLILALAANVVKWRLRTKVSLGDGEHKELRQAIRSHGNTTEYLPLALLALALLEANGAEPWLLHAYGITLLIARIVYSLGLAAAKSINLKRQASVIATWLVMVVMSLQLIWQMLR